MRTATTVNNNQPATEQVVGKAERAHYNYIKVRSGSFRSSKSKEDRLQVISQTHEFRRQSIEIVDDETCALFKVKHTTQMQNLID